jgi:hypothetical protein
MAEEPFKDGDMVKLRPRPEMKITDASDPNAIEVTWTANDAVQRGKYPADALERVKPHSYKIQDWNV